MEKPLRVLQIMGIVENGGVESVIMNYYRHLDRNKVQFDFVMHKGSNCRYINEASKLGANIFEITPYNKNIISFTWEIYKIIKNEKYRIVHSNMNSLSVFPLFAAWLAGCKVRILHNHTTDTKAEGLRTIIKRFLRPFAKKFSNQYWACSKLAAIWMYGNDAVKEGKVTIVHNAIDIEKFKYNEESRIRIRKKMNLYGKFVVGHIGRFVKQKNHEFLIDIFTKVVQKNPEAVLLLIGDGPMLTSIKKKVNKEKIQDKVYFLGVRNDVAELYSVMDVFVLPSFYEGLPIVGVEAQVNGLPFICSNLITKEILFNKSTIMLSLDAGREVWANEVLRYRRNSSPEEIIKIKELGFDINTEANRLVGKYVMF